MKHEITKPSHLTDDDIRTLTQAGIIPEGTPPAIVKVFAVACASHGLSPFKKEIYLVRYNTKNGVQYHTIVGIDGLRAKAARTGQFAGRDNAQYDLQPSGQFLTASQVKSSGKIPISCTVTVYRMIVGQRCPFTKTVVFSEYYPAVANPSPERKDFSKAATMPFNMIEKCAEAAVLRMAFADETAGLHIQEESAAIEDVTVQAAETRPELTIDAEALRDRLESVWTIPGLMDVYNENTAHRQFAEMFTVRKEELQSLVANGQIPQQ